MHAVDLDAGGDGLALEQGGQLLHVLAADVVCVVLDGLGHVSGHEARVQCLGDQVRVVLVHSAEYYVVVDCTFAVRCSIDVTTVVASIAFVRAPSLTLAPALGAPLCRLAHVAIDVHWHSAREVMGVWYQHHNCVRDVG